MIKYPELIFEQMEIGPMQNFQYFIGDAQSREVGIVDPAWDIDFLRARAQQSGYQITCALLTHGHYDHTTGVNELLSTHNIPVYLSKHEALIYRPACKNLRMVEDREKITIGKIQIECLRTPGHSPGCQCFKYKDILMTGDTLFINGCGRCDLPGGNPEKMYHSLYDTLLKLPDSTVIYPGHRYGPVPFATLAEQKKTNPYLKSRDKKEFIDERR